MADRPASPPPAGDTACWAFGPSGGEVLVRNAELLLAHLPVFLAGWPFRRLGDSADREATIEVAERAGGRIAVMAGGPVVGESVFDNAFDAADALANTLISAFVARADDLVCVRAAGVRVRRGLAVLLGGAQAGKSSIALQLAAAGYRLFGDDRLALRLAPEEPDAGLCLGLNPRIGLPLPPGSGSRLAEYVDSFTEMRDETMAYLKLWEGEAAGFLEEAPVAALVLLERRAEGPCRIAPAPGPEIVTSLRAAISSPADSAGPEPSLARLSSRVPGYRVAFSSSREAASALAEALRAGG